MRNPNKISNLLNEMNHVLDELGKTFEEELKDKDDMIDMLFARVNCLEDQINKQRDRNKEIARLLMED